MQEEKLPISEEKPPVQEVYTPKKKSIGFGFDLDDLEKEIEQDAEKKLAEKEKTPITEDHSCATASETIDSETLTEDNLIVVWNKLMDWFKSNEQSTLHELLSDNIPKLVNKKLELTLDSSVEKEHIEKNIGQIKGFLKRNFKDFEDLQLLVTTSKKSKKVLLNQKDKFLKLVKKNPLLNKLRIDLDLELEM